MSFKMDFHVHSDFSPDSKTPMAQMVQRALELGITDLAFTDHIDLEYDLSVPDGDWIFDQDQYFEEIAYNRKKFEQINLYAGVEIGLQPHLSEKYVKTIGDRPYDFIIASLHSVDRKDLFKGALFQEYAPQQAISRYFEQYLESIESFDVYDVLGHLDLYVRYEDKTRKVPFKSYSDILEVILMKVIDSGKGIELNAGGFRYNLDSNNPSDQIIKLYKQLKGEIITLGSDAHTPETLGLKHDANMAYLKSRGFDYVTVFKNRNPQMISIK